MRVEQTNVSLKSAASRAALSLLPILLLAACVRTDARTVARRRRHPYGSADSRAQHAELRPPRAPHAAHGNARRLSRTRARAPPRCSKSWPRPTSARRTARAPRSGRRRTSTPTSSRSCPKRRRPHLPRCAGCCRRRSASSGAAIPSSKSTTHGSTPSWVGRSVRLSTARAPSRCVPWPCDCARSKRGLRRTWATRRTRPTGTPSAGGSTPSCAGASSTARRDSSRATRSSDSLRGSSTG